MIRDNPSSKTNKKLKAPIGSKNNPWIRIKKHKNGNQIVPECCYLLRPSGIWRISSDKLPKSAFVKNLKS